MQQIQTLKRNLATPTSIVTEPDTGCVGSISIALLSRGSTSLIPWLYLNTSISITDSPRQFRLSKPQDDNMYEYLKQYILKLG